MICPKCGHNNLPGLEDCSRCGVIFAKIKSEAGPTEQISEIAYANSGRNRGQTHSTLRDLFLPDPGESNSLLFWGRSLILLGMIIWGTKLMFVSIASNTAGESLLHLINLPFHEAGHLIFRPLGSFMSSLGGSLTQLLVPMVCGMVLLVKTRDPFGAAVCVWWFGENLLDLAPYINDARAGVLPLLGGNTGNSSPYGFHDWEYLLTETGLLRHDHLLAKLAHGFGSLFMVTAMLWAGYQLYLQFRKPETSTQKIAE